MRKPSPTTVIALVALFVALGGPAKAAKLISGSKLKNNSVTSAKIRNHTLSSADIRRSTLNSLKRTGSTVTSGNIVDGTIQLEDMGFGSVTGNQVVDHSLAGVDLAPDSISATEIATGTIGATELGADSVLNKSLKDGAVSKTKLAKDAVAESEVRDGSLTAKDVGAASGSLTVALGSLAAQSCKTQAFDQTIELGGGIVLVNAPADGLLATARVIDAAPPNADKIQVQVCNPTAAPVVADGSYPFVAFAP
jgi:hypothetical protein